MKKKDMKLTRSRAKTRRRRNKKNRYSISRTSIIGVFVLCLFVSLILSRGAAAEDDHMIVVNLNVEDVSIIQGEGKPIFKAAAACSGDTSQELSEDTGYTVQDLLDELNQGIGYTLDCEADGSQEGNYAIKAELTSDMTTPLNSEWFGKVRIDIQDGVFEVKNQYGEWDGSKFRRWDGSYVTEDFITYQNKTYYFGKDGEKVSGWQEIKGSKYYFSKKGVMKTGWFEDKKAKYYFDETGIMCLGWMELDGEKYYFDQEGKMVTGEQKIGSRDCVFGKDGKLKSAEGGIDPNLPMVALTFDDGPGQRTDELLDVLEKNHAHATFFMLGQKVEKYGDTVKKMADIGCELGNHSYDHTNLTKLDSQGIQTQIGDTNSLIAQAAGQRATLARPPYGAINDEVRADIGMPMIFWSIDTLDWKTRDAQKTIDNVMNNVQDGDVILMHDIHTETIDAAVELVPKLIDAGYQLVTVSELAEARGVRLENGARYSQFWKTE